MRQASKLEARSNQLANALEKRGGSCNPPLITEVKSATYYLGKTYFYIRVTIKLGGYHGQFSARIHIIGISAAGYYPTCMMFGASWCYFEPTLSIKHLR